MEPIKKIAGDLLLFFYARQRKRGFPDGEIIQFGNADDKGVVMNNSEISKEVMKICKNSKTDAYNAICYLSDKLFISYKESPNIAGVSIYNLRVRAPGVDIIEGIERNKEGRNNFYITFNMKLADNIKIDNLLKNELGSLVKFGLI